MRLGAISLLVAVLVAIAMPATALAGAGDTWYRTALVRRDTEPPYRSQLDDSIYARSDCGPAVLGMALADYGVDMDTLDLRRLTHTYQGTWPAVRVGTALQYMAQVADELGLSSHGLYAGDNGDESSQPSEAAAGDSQTFHQWTVDEIQANLVAGRLVIPLVRFGLLPGHEDTGVRWGHYILLYAIQGDGFDYQDPAVRPIEDGRARWISRKQLEQAMAPVYPPRQAVALGT